MEETAQTPEPAKKKKIPRFLLPLVLLTKSAKIVKFVKIIKLLKFSKFLITFLSMILSVFVYSLALGPWFAAGFVLMIFIHEMGHVMAMERKGYPTSAPVFIPMLGAVIFAPKFRSPDDEAYIGFGGPLIGGLAALISFEIWLLLPHKSELLLLVSYTAASVNLFNLLPLRPLDGGRVTHVVGRWFKWIGVAGLVGLTILIKQPSILLIWIVVLQDLRLLSSLKFAIGLSCFISMTILMVMGYSQQHWAFDIFDIVFSCLLVVIMYGEMRGKLPTQEEDRVDAPLRTRLKWFGLYLALLLGLVGLMMLQAPHLSHLVKR